MNLEEQNNKIEHKNWTKSIERHCKAKRYFEQQQQQKNENRIELNGM